ncbi:MAG: bifunctional indole-3-glycerol phosphate synthase/phosphoribosylanthranilate isomerase, partial [Spirochaetaceae bacterium]|nr:bifunctional indole-3-glycerol phosphate synthase/phosphoribosylanthranilate isomerase [Spirochaetaceae bacterium]
VIVEPESEAAAEAYQLVKEGVLDVIQVHTFEAAKAFLQKKELAALPHYCAVNISCEDDIKKLDELAKLGEPRILVDAHSAETPGGTGKTIDETLLSAIAKKYSLWIAGGLSLENIRRIKKTFKPELVDLVSSLEKEQGIKDAEKLITFLEKI